MRVFDIHNLEQHAEFQGENFFLYQNLPIKWVRIVGVVVAMDEFAGRGINSVSRRVYTVDDSSGACIEATLLMPAETNKPGTAGGIADVKTRAAPPPCQDIDVGAVVDIKGALSTFRDEKQVKIEKFSRLRGTAQEVAIWEKRDRFRRDVLERPWVLGRRDIRRCMKEAEKEDGGAKRERKRPEATTKGQDNSKHASGKKASSVKAAGNLKDMVRGGVITGKYDALGL